MIRFPPDIRHQVGVVSIAIAMLLIFILVAAVASVSKISGSSVIDSANHDEQIAALFIAESAVERAQAIISAEIGANNFSNTTCTNLAGQSGTMGRGSYEYLTAVSQPSSCTGNDCTNCTVTIRASVNNSTRTIRTDFSTSSTTGVKGCSDNFAFGFPVESSGNASILSNIVFRAKPVSGTCAGGANSNANIDTCTNSGGSCDLTAQYGWHVDAQGTNNVISKGVRGAAASSGTYTLNFTLAGNVPATRSYAGTSLIMYPLSGNIGSVGAYGASGKTSSTSSLTGVVPDGWTCSPSSGNSNNLSLAASADTLIMGFGALGLGPGQEATRITFGQQPLFKKVSITGQNGDYIYSQMWLSYNPAYYATGAVNNATTFSGTGCVGDNTSSITSNPVCAGTTGNTLVITSVTPGTKLRVGDTIYNGVTPLGTVTAFGTVSADGTGTYTIDGGPHPTISPPTALTGRSPITAISGTTATAPKVGTVFDVVSGTGALGSVTISARMTSNTIMSVPSGPQPELGDAIFGTFAEPGTRIIAKNGTDYTVTPAQTTYPLWQDSAALARTAVRGPDSGAVAPESTYFIVSRAPTTTLSNAVLCGGVCPFLRPFSGSGGNTGTSFNIVGLTSGRDWSAGVACLSNVDPSRIQFMSGVGGNLKKSIWSELVQ